MILLLGYGSIGQKIYAELRALNLPVTVVSRRFDNPENPDFIEIEYSDLKNHEELFVNTDLIIHTIHSSRPGSFHISLEQELELNLEPLRKLTALAKKHSINQLIYLSSGGAVYGRVSGHELINENHLTQPVSIYGKSKLIIEHFLSEQQHIFNQKLLILRPSNVYGVPKTQNPKGIIDYIAHACKHKLPIEIWGDGNGLKGYLSNVDLAQGIVQLIMKPEPHIGTFNICSGQYYSVNQLMDLFEQKYNFILPKKYTSTKAFDVPTIRLDDTKIRSSINWNPSINLSNFIHQL